MSSLVFSGEFVIVEHARTPEFSHYWREDPKVTGVTGAVQTNSAAWSHTGKEVGISEKYSDREQAEMDCVKMNEHNPSGYYAVCPLLVPVLISIPKTRYVEFASRNFDPKKDGRRWGQAFHQFMDLEKVTSTANKIWCDRLYNESDTQKAISMVLNQLDHCN